MLNRTIAIVGRPNVGKSTLFNRLVEKRKAIATDEPGTTRDRIYGQFDLEGRLYELIDTGGLELIKEADKIQKLIQIQAQVAIAEAEMILFVVDGREGLNPLDTYVAQLLRKSKKNVLLLVNKIDSHQKQSLTSEFYTLGFGEPIWISAQHGVNVDPLLTALSKAFPDEETAEENDQSQPVKLAIVGQPNVGKSSLLNCFLDTDRVMVDDKAGTTRDPVEVPFQMGDRFFQLIDTAGIRRVNQLKNQVDKIAVIFSEKVIERADLVLFIIDARNPLSAQDKRIAGMILENEKPCIVVANKWDLIENKEEKMKLLLEEFEEDLYFLKHCPMITISALKGSRVAKLQDVILDLMGKLNIRVNTNHLNHLIQEAVTVHQPPSYKGKQLKIYYVSQIRNRRGTFVFQVNNSNLVHFSYYRYLENTIREHYKFTGLPLKLVFRGKGEQQEL